PLRPPMEPAAQGAGGEKTHEGGTGNFHDARMEAIRRRHGTGLPSLATPPAEMKRAGPSQARRHRCDVVASRSRRRDRSEEPVCLTVRTGREEQRVDWAIVDRPVPELQCPEPVDPELPSI